MWDVSIFSDTAWFVLAIILDAGSRENGCSRSYFAIISVTAIAGKVGTNLVGRSFLSGWMPFAYC